MIDSQIYVDEPVWIEVVEESYDDDDSIFVYPLRTSNRERVNETVGYARTADLAVLFAHSPELHEVSQEILALLRTMPIDNNLPAIKRLEQVLQKINRGEGR